jgi:hypothetical protein
MPTQYLWNTVGKLTVTNVATVGNSEVIFDRFDVNTIGTSPKIKQKKTDYSKVCGNKNLCNSRVGFTSSIRNSYFKILLTPQGSIYSKNLNTVCTFWPDRFQQNAQWMWSSPLTDIGLYNVYGLWHGLSYNTPPLIPRATPRQPLARYLLLYYPRFSLTL